MTRPRKNVVLSEDPISDDAQAAFVPRPASVSKIARVIALLERTGGASLADLIENTGWLPHTTRAALTGLRKKGHVIAKESRNGMTFYNIGMVTR